MTRRGWLWAIAGGSLAAIAAGTDDADDPMQGRRVVDFEADTGTAPPVCYRVVDAATGEDLGAAWPITFASEATGLVRIHSGGASRELHRAIRIVPRAEFAPRIHRIEARHRAWQRHLNRVPTIKV